MFTRRLDPPPPATNSVSAPPSSAESCQARFVGRKTVRGNLNDIGLSLVVTDLRQAEAKSKAKSREKRCNLELGEKSLQVTFVVKRDEGFFESDGDGDSTKSSTSTEEVNKNDEVKVVQDHVFSGGNSNGANLNNSTSGSDSETSHGYVSAKSTSPTADIQSFKLDHKETYPLQDVLICHADREVSNYVVWVVRGGSTLDLEALVFECYHDEDVKRICRKFLDFSKRLKLERNRRRKSDGGGNNMAKSVEALFSNGKGKSPQLQKASFDGAAKNWNLVQHTDKNGVTHLEVESDKVKSTGKKNNNNDQSSSSLKGVKPRTNSKFALELETILSRELETRSKDQQQQQQQQPPQSLKSESRQLHVGEPLSLRQRAPALLLRKLDEFEERASRVWSKHHHEDIDENRKVWAGARSQGSPNQHQHHHHNHNHSNNNPKYPSKMASRTPPLSHRRNHLRKQLFVNGNGPHSPKVRAPSPPPDISPVASVEPSTNNGKGNKSEVLMVPTKTGREPSKKLYPKETPQTPHPHLQPPILHLSPHLPLQPIHHQPHSLPIFPAVQLGSAPIAWARYPPPEEGQLHHLLHHQQQWAAAARVNAIMHQQQQQQQQQQQPQTDRQHRGRSRDRTDNARRRAQSKSPARAKLLQEQLENNSPPTSSAGISRKFKEFGEALRFKVGSSKKSQQLQQPTNFVASPSNGVLKSNLKKQTSNNTLVGGNGNDDGSMTALNSSTEDSNNDNRKVHFNKFATVQMME